MGFFVLVWIVVTLLWVTAGARAYEQKNRKTAHKFFLHLFIGVISAGAIVGLIYTLNFDCDYPLTCAMHQLILSGLTAALILLIYPIVLLFIWRPIKKKINHPY